jgi:hypothetical protein
MKLIAHRGNINGPNELNENNPKYIDTALDFGYDVEIDIRYNFKDNIFYLGHDYSTHEIDLDWIFLRKSRLWIHCKDIESLYFFSTKTKDYNYFWHQNDSFTITSKGYIWTYPGEKITPNSIVVMPEWNIGENNFNSLGKYKCFGICSDFVSRLK